MHSLQFNLLKQNLEADGSVMCGRERDLITYIITTLKFKSDLVMILEPDLWSPNAVLGDFQSPGIFIILVLIYCSGMKIKSWDSVKNCLITLRYSTISVERDNFKKDPILAS